MYVQSCIHDGKVIESSKAKGVKKCVKKKSL